MGQEANATMNIGDRIQVRITDDTSRTQTKPMTRPDDSVELSASSRSDTMPLMTHVGANHFEGHMTLTLHATLDISSYEEWWAAKSNNGKSYKLRFSQDFPTPTHAPRYIDAETVARINLPFGEGEYAGWHVTAWRHYQAPTLQQWRDNHPGPLKINLVTAIIRSIESIMRPLHEKGLVFVNVLPEQIMIDDELSTAFKHTEEVFALGESVADQNFAPGFVSPRLFDGTGERRASLDADTYLLAALTWFLLTGSKPPSTSLTQFTPAAPLRAFVPQLPPGIAPVIENVLTNPSTSPFARPRDYVQKLKRESIRGQMVNNEPLSEFQLVGETHPGIAKRIATPINQDSIFYQSSEDTALMLIADGVSTARYGRGDIASQLLRDEVEHAWNTLDKHELKNPESRKQWLAAILRRANQNLIEEVNERFSPFNSSKPLDVMATTATIALIHHGTFTLASLGDSPAYLIRDGAIERLNRDHNVMTLELAAGASPESIDSIAWPEALSRCLGTYALANNGRLVPRDSDVDYLEANLFYGDRLIICSDGVTDYIGGSLAEAEEYLLELMIEEPSPSLAALDTIYEANRGGGGDNISIVLFYAEEQLEPLVLTSEYVTVDDYEAEE